METVNTKDQVTVPKSVAQRASRKRFSFGPVWNAAVIAEKAKDFDKLLAQAVKLNLGTSDELKGLKLAALRSKVAEKLKTDASTEAV